MRPDRRALYVCTDLTPGTIAAADCTGVLRAETGKQVGAAVELAGDLDGDGLTDLAAIEWAPGSAGAVVLLRSPLVDTVWVEDEATSIFGLSDEQIGNGSVKALGDVDGDGCDDLAFTGPGESSAYDAGMPHVAFGPFVGTISVEDAGLPYSNQGDGNSFRGSDVAVGDMGVDGLVDVLVTAPDTEPDESGMAWVLGLPTDRPRRRATSARGVDDAPVLRPRLPARCGRPVGQGGRHRHPRRRRERRVPDPRQL